MSNRRPGVGGGAKVEVQSSSDRSLSPSFLARQCHRRPEAARARLRAQSERLAWSAYLRAVRLQWDEPGPETLIIRRAVLTVWEQTFLGQAS